MANNEYATPVNKVITNEYEMDQSRVVYVDPNSVYGRTKNGALLSPDYSDFTLWANLSVERTSRLKNREGGRNSTNTAYIYSGTLDNGKCENMSFMVGKDGDKYNWRTTDYTNIDFDEVKKRNIIEGIGIESIQVQYDNMYIPSVTIKFIDVRGGGFFAREEATHTATYGKFINLENGLDNFYSSFVTLPYPRYRLQLKGYYGDAVTYQLVCTKFDGEFNSETGNFEITCKFLGEQYSILGDIPFEYIAAAPLCTYAGAEYWDKHKNNAEWRMSDGRPPIIFYKLFRTVKQKLSSTSDGDLGSIIDDSDYDSESSLIETKYNLLSDIKTEINALVDSFSSGDGFMISRKRGDIYFDGLYLMEKPNESYANFDTYYDDYLSIDTYKSGLYEQLIENIDKYNRYCQVFDFNPRSDRVKCQDDDNRQRFNFNDKKPVLKYENGNWFIYEDNNTLTQLTSDYINKMDGDKFLDKFVDVFNSGVMFDVETKKGDKSDIKNKLVELISNQDNRGVGDYYGFCVKFGDIPHKLRNLTYEIELKTIDLEEKRKYNAQKKAIGEVLGFTPYIGNFFKNVMCHLETFIHIIYTCADNIEGQIAQGDREYKKLGIVAIGGDDKAYTRTDIPNYGENKDVPPFPYVFENSNYMNTNVNNLTESYNTFAWLDNFHGSTEWEEVKMITALRDAIELNNPNIDRVVKSTTSESIINDRFPVLPSDLQNDIPKEASKSLDNFAAYFVLRFFAIQQSPIQDVYKIENIGTIDGYNFLTQLKNPTLFCDYVLTSDSGNSICDEIINMVTCSSTWHDSKYTFEFAPQSNGRQPILTEADGFDGCDEYWRYVYMLDKDQRWVLPHNFTSSCGANNFDRVTDENGTIFSLKLNSDGTLKTPELYSKDTNEVSDNPKLEYNPNKFMLYLTSDKILKIKDIFDKSISDSYYGYDTYEPLLDMCDFRPLSIHDDFDLETSKSIYTKLPNAAPIYEYVENTQLYIDMDNNIPTEFIDSIKETYQNLYCAAD